MAELSRRAALPHAAPGCSVGRAAARLLPDALFARPGAAQAPSVRAAWRVLPDFVFHRSPPTSLTRSLTVPDAASADVKMVGKKIAARAECSCADRCFRRWACSTARSTATRCSSTAASASAARPMRCWRSATPSRTPISALGRHRPCGSIRLNRRQLGFECGRGCPAPGRHAVRVFP